MNHQAIYKTHPNVVSIDDGEGAKDANGNSVEIDQSAYDAEVARLQAEQDATQYQRDRKAEYPSMDELVVALWEAVIEERMASSIDLQGKRIAIKDKYPKP